MKHALLIVPAVLILFTTACTAALVAPAALMFEANSHEDSSAATVAENTPAPQEQSAPAPVHVSGVKDTGQHISGKTSRRHISGGSYSHVSGGGYY